MKREWLKQTELWTSETILIHLQYKLEGAQPPVALPQLVEAQALKPLTDLHHCHLQTPHLQMHHLRINHLPTAKAKVPNPSGIREEMDPKGEYLIRSDLVTDVPGEMMEIILMTLTIGLTSTLARLSEC